MNKNNPLYEYADKLNEYGVKLVKKFMQSEEYAELHLKMAEIDADIWKAEQEYWKKVRELRATKRNIELHEIPNARNEYVRQHIEDYKTHLKTKEANNPIEAYMQITKSEANHG